MKLKVHIEVDFGMSHYGSEWTEDDREIEISEKEAEELTALLKENNDNVDQNILPAAMPHLHERIDAEGARLDWNYWVVRGFQDGYYDIDSAIISEYVYEDIESGAFKPSQSFEAWCVAHNIDTDDEDFDEEDARDEYDNEIEQEWLDEQACDETDDEACSELNDRFGIDPDSLYDGCTYTITSKSLEQQV